MARSASPPLPSLKLQEKQASLPRLWRVEESAWLSESESMFSYDEYVFIMVFNLEFFDIPENLCPKN
jgi:hypothetical protein